MNFIYAIILCNIVYEINAELQCGTSKCIILQRKCSAITRERKIIG